MLKKSKCMKQKKHILKKTKVVLINILILTVFLLIGEKTFLKSLDSEIIEPNSSRHINLYEHKLNSKIKFPRNAKLKTKLNNELISFQTDSNGFIEGENIVESYDDLIYFIGGSTTECLQVDQNKRFPYLVQENLRKESLKVKTINSGISGSNSYLGFLSFLTKGAKTNPDYLVLMYNVNDITQLSITGSYYENINDWSLIKKDKHIGFKGLMRNIKDQFFHNSWLLLKIISNQINKSEVEPEQKTLQTKNQNNNEILIKFRKSIMNYVAFCKENNINLVLMTQFNRIEENNLSFVKEYNSYNRLKPVNEYVNLYKKANDVIRDISKSNNIPLIDLDYSIPKNDQHIYDSVHLTNEGSVLVTDLLTNFFFNQLK